MERISSRQNAIVKRFRNLIRSGSMEGAVLLDGAHLLDEALSSGAHVDVAVFAEPLVAGTLAPLVARTEARGIRTIVVTPQVLSALSPVRQPSGVVAIARLHSASLDDALRGDVPLVVVLHEVQDPGNVGAIIRAAEASGATGVVTTSGTADPLGWKSLRGSMGSALRMPIAANAVVPEVLAAVKRRHIPLVAAVPRDGTPLTDADLKGPAAILVGGEGAGIPRDLLAQADMHLTIPMRPPVESLNVAIAASLVLYEAARQRTR